MSEQCLVPGHRHSIFCFVPPHLLREIAIRGDDRQRRFALDTLGHDTTNRSHRQVMARSQQSVVNPAVIGRSSVVHRNIYDDKHGTRLPGSLVRAEGHSPVGDENVNEAYDGLGHVFDFYLKIYQRNSIDNAGMTMNATVHYSKQYNNAFWNGTQMIFGDGDGQIFTSFTKPLDVIGHELTHGVTQHEAGLAYQDQSGALNESVSDVFGVMVKQYVLNQTAAQADWLIGEGLLTFANQALRSMKAPGTAYDNSIMGKDPQPADMAHYVQTQQDNGGVHLNSGIPNRAFFLAATAIGGHAWEKAGLVWYDTLRDPALRNQSQTATFASFANLTITHAASRYGAASAERAAVLKAWQTVGVLP
jgi:Zn-dependent metalloprotease